jgi:sugar lactone lactonase YvrE/uncharacterized RDD family membrane protein YckC
MEEAPAPARGVDRMPPTHPVDHFQDLGGQATTNLDGGNCPPPVAEEKLGQPRALLTKTYTSWIRRAGAAIIDATPFVLFWGFNFVYVLVRGVTCRADGFAFCGPPLKDISLGFLTELELLLLALGLRPVVLLVLLLLLLLAPGLISVLQMVLGARLGPLLIVADQMPPLLVGNELVLLLAYAVWNWGYRQGTTGSTIGKSLLKFRVVSEETGQPIGFAGSIVREFAHVADWIIFYVGYLFPLWDAKRRTLADMIMSTVCLTTPALQSRAGDPRRKLKVGLIPGVVVVLAAAGVTGYVSSPASFDVRLPFTGLNSPSGVAVDHVGDLYVADAGNNRVVRLAAGSSAQTVLPFVGLNRPSGVAVDSVGNVYVSDAGNNRLVNLAAGSSTQYESFTGLNEPGGVAVDSNGSVYVADTGNNRVLRLSPGSSTQTVLPFTGLNRPEAVAVDITGAVYVADAGNNRVVRLAAGSSTQAVVPFIGLTNPVSPHGVAVDAVGSLYVTDWGIVLKLATGSSTPTVLRFPAPYPRGVAVDTAGATYVTDYGGSQVVKLAECPLCHLIWG